MRTFQLRKVKGMWRLKENGKPAVDVQWSRKSEAVSCAKDLIKKFQKQEKVGISLRICTANGEFQTEYTYTKKFDPRKSKG